ncbi:helix-turn-helix domain-containing protein [Planotetraspora phitsanulokensis]|uniref:helix-turn-helix domain-containing protein n=1 Tax=Planotetraspora phitsanulokensis TaxID=575192 RepID=UPI00194F41E5|nr:helix-turn-helix transcriptional regulator [Planotetraspora phitsanulokensis]
MDSGKLLGEFLQARRKLVTPDEIGLKHSGRRRTPGLRREEMAFLAGVSTDYYSRLEQGRERNPSDQVLAALARALDLDSEAAQHLYALAHPRARRDTPVSRMEPVSPMLLRLLRGWNHTPAMVLGRWMDVLAMNPIAEALYDGLKHNDNLIRMVFLNPESREFYADWEKIAYYKAAHLRAVAGTDPDDPFLPGLVEELSEESDEFRRLWARHDVHFKTHDAKQFRHRDVGELNLVYESFTVNSAPGQQLMIFQAEPGSETEKALAMLGGLSSINALVNDSLVPAPTLTPAPAMTPAKASATARRSGGRDLVESEAREISARRAMWQNAW